jgi:hypothetical protein
MSPAQSRFEINGAVKLEDMRAAGPRTRESRLAKMRSPRKKVNFAKALAGKWLWTEQR